MFEGILRERRRTMSRKVLIHGVMATTHIDRHGERFSKEALDHMAQDSPEYARLVYWDHQTTLPPIGLVGTQSVERRQDGEYQLVVEAQLLASDQFQLLPVSGVKGVDMTWEQVKDIVEGVPPSPSGHLRVSYDPRNFDADEVAGVMEEINQLVHTEVHLYVRKAQLPPAVIWIFVGFVGGQIASGFFSRLGELAAEKMVEVVGSFHDQLSERFARLLRRGKPWDTEPDVILGLRIPGSDTLVEGAVENAEGQSLRTAFEELPTLYAIATHLIERNSPDFFLVMRFLLNPETRSWEINYLVTRKTSRVIMGPRYYDPTHPLRARYEKIVAQASKAESGDSAP